MIIVQAPKEDTKKGVKQISTAMFLYLISQCLLFGVAIIFYVAVLPALFAAGPGNIAGLLGLLIALLVILLALLIIILASLILGLLGLLKMRKGMEEFGPEHRAAVESATVLIVLGVVASVGGSMVGLMVGGGGNPAGIAFQLVASGIAGVISAALIGLGVVRLAEKLADAGERQKLWAFFGLTLAATIAAAVIAFVWAVVALPGLQQGNFAGLGSLGLLGVSSIVTAIAYYFGWSGYSSIARKMEDGKLVPGMPLPGTGAAAAAASAARAAVPTSSPPRPK